MNHVTKFFATLLVLVVLLIPTSVLLSKFVFTTSYSYACVVEKVAAGLFNKDQNTVALKIELVGYPWGQGYNVLRLQEDLYASYDPSQHLTISDKRIFASQNQNNRLKTVSFDRVTGQIIFQEIFQSNHGTTLKETSQGLCAL